MLSEAGVLLTKIVKSIISLARKNQDCNPFWIRKSQQQGLAAKAQMYFGFSLC